MIHRLLAKTVTEFRWRAHLSREQVCQRAQMSEAELAALESGELDVDLLTLNRLCGAINIQIEELFEKLSVTEGPADDGKPLSELELTFLSSVYDTPPQPQTPEDYERALRWYRLRKERFLWQRKRRQMHVARLKESVRNFQRLRTELYRLLDEIPNSECS